jgi:Type III restriction enzyme, res subunit
MTDVWQFRCEQSAAFRAIQGKSRAILNTPTGWGKGFLLCGLSAADLLQPGRKVILCIPQRIIAKGFKSDKEIQLPDGRKVHWTLPRNLCQPTLEKVAQLLDFIRSPARKAPEERVVLATHMSISYAFDKLNDDEIARLFQKTTLVIDEAHHVHASEHGRNALGHVVASLLDLNDSTTKVLLATAYFFRGDHLPIIPDEHLPRFYRHHVPFDEYWSSLNYVKTYSYDFVAYKGRVFKELELLLRRSHEPTIVYCPPEGHKMLIGKNKRSFVNRVRSLCEEHLLAKLWTPDTKVDSNRKVVVDLVTASHRSEKIAFVAEHGDCVAAVLTVGMFKEGADWVEAARIIDLVPTGSDQDRLQRFGRLVRDCPNKHHVSYYSFVPYIVEDNEEERRVELSKLYAHFHASLVLENAIKPIKVCVGRKAQTTVNESSDKGDRLDLLGRLSERIQEAVISQSFEDLMRLHNQKAKEGLAVAPAEAKEVIYNVLKENGVTTDVEATAKQIVLVMRRKSGVRIDAEDLVEAGFDNVYSVDIFDGLIAYSAGLGGPSTLADIRRVIEGVFDRQWMENYEKVHELAAVPRTQSNAYWWCTHNRVLHDQGKLPPDRVRLLEAIEWWKWTEGFEDRWQSRHDEISSLPACPNAGTTEYGWVRQQRRQYDKGKLEPFKIRLCESISWWSWKTKRDTWQATFEHLKAASAPPERGTKEYEWLRTQRKANKAARLSDDRAAKLESIAWWSWGDGERSRQQGPDQLKSLIDAGLEEGSSKTEVQNRWAAIVGNGGGPDS